jgi:hypothetical protein
MLRPELAEKLIAAKSAAEKTHLLAANKKLADEKLALEIKDICYAAWTSVPTKARKTAGALKSLYQFNPQKEIKALLLWVEGISELTKGKLESAIQSLDLAAEIFLELRREHEAAQTRVARLIALALLGRYEEAVETGESALKVLEKYGDELTAGKVEKNLGNIVSRQDLHLRAEKYYLSARKRFIKTGEKSEQTMAENGLAITYTQLNDFRKAEKFFAHALENAYDTNMFLTAAEIEASMGNLALFRGKYDEALRFLELSRRKYEELNMPHQTAVAALEIADIYRELNLTREAFEIYSEVSGKLKKLKLQGEEARTRANFGRVAALLSETALARRELERSAQLYELEKNKTGAAAVKLEEAGLELGQNNTGKAREIISEAETLLGGSESFRNKLALKLLKADAFGRAGDAAGAEGLLSEALAEANRQEQPNIALAALNSLGKLARAGGDARKAKKYFRKAVGLIENLRAPLAAEEFRMAFLADKLEPFENLAAISLGENKLLEAFLYTESARSRALADILKGDTRQFSRSDVPSELTGKLARLREELNWYYSRLDRARDKDTGKLQEEAKRREKQIAVLMRQIESTDKRLENHPGAKAPHLLRMGSLKENHPGAKAPPLLCKEGSLKENHPGAEAPSLLRKERSLKENHPGAKAPSLLRKERSLKENHPGAKAPSLLRKEGSFDAVLLQKQLGKKKLLVEFVNFAGAFSAFIVDDKKIRYVKDLATNEEVLALLEGLQFQFGALRYGAKIPERFRAELKGRADRYLQKLYEKLLRPLENYFGERELVIVPAAALYYVPFHGLHDGEKYLIESREVVYSPSAAVWQALQRKPRRALKSALLMGFADESIPLVNNEINELKKIFPAAKSLTGKNASYNAFTDNAPKFDLLHLACHGQFRPENPMFSSLHLADGWVTVRDICAQKLRAGLVTLSACETGLNKVFAGDEIIGLARGFLSAGVSSLILSLWTVNDAAAAKLMKSFYKNLQRGHSIPASIRIAQNDFIKREEHPYFWSPFALIGR